MDRAEVRNPWSASGVRRRPRPGPLRDGGRELPNRRRRSRRETHGAGGPPRQRNKTQGTETTKQQRKRRSRLYNPPGRQAARPGSGGGPRSGHSGAEASAAGGPETATCARGRGHGPRRVPAPEQLGHLPPRRCRPGCGRWSGTRRSVL